jgi:hypothetical protein
MVHSVPLPESHASMLVFGSVAGTVLQILTPCIPLFQVHNKSDIGNGLWTGPGTTPCGAQEALVSESL